MKKIAVSACLLGQPVRYDGGNKITPLIKNCISKQFEIIPVCPEFEAGLGIPRPPMHLIKDKAQYKAVLVDEPFTNLTQPLTLQSHTWLSKNKDIAGLIVKARSPSCGYKTAKVYNDKPPINTPLKTSGLFVATILKGLPNIPIIDEESLADIEQREAFIQAVKRYDNEKRQ